MFMLCREDSSETKAIAIQVAVGMRRRHSDDLL